MRKCNSCGQNLNLQRNFYYEHNRSRGTSYYRRLCKKCVHNQRRARYSQTPELFLGRSFSQLRSARQKMGWAFDISLPEVTALYHKQSGKCALSGVRMTWRASEKRDDKSFLTNQYNISIDRIDNEKGYEIKNIQLVCKHVNLMKHVVDNDIFVEWCQRITNNQKSKR
jgi:hypothetical protein